MLAINIPADGLFLAIQHAAGTDLSAATCERIVCDYIDRFLSAGADLILLNVCYRRALTPSEVFDSYLYDIETDENGHAVKNERGESAKRESPTAEGLTKYFGSFFTVARVLLKNGIDIYQFALERIRKAGRRVYLSLRMNDGHYIDNPAVNSSFAMKNGGENAIEKKGEYLDFSKAAVQNLYCAYISELLSRYAPDGVELDWMRFPTLLPEEKRSDTSILTRFMGRVRSLLDRERAGTALAVRVLAKESDNLAEGIDAARWIASGYTDMLTVENFYIPTNYELPVSDWRASIEEKNQGDRPYSLLCGADWGVCCRPKYHIAMTPALVRGFADASLGAGADGLYLFNFFEENDESSFAFAATEDGKGGLENCFLSRMIAAKHPEVLPRRYVHIGADGSRYPIRLHKGGAYTLTVRLHRPYERGRIVVGCGGEAALSVFVGGHRLAPLQGVPSAEGFAFVPEQELKSKGLFLYALTQVAPFVGTSLFPAELAEGEARIEIRNESERELAIFWLELVCE